MKTLVNVRASSWLLLVGLCSSYVLAMGLPLSWGWENGPLESFQAVLLLVGACLAGIAAYQQRDMAAGKVWCVAILLWLGMLGRELSWGAVFKAPLGMDPLTGPLYSSNVLWWKPAVVWVCSAMLAAALYWVVRYRLITRVGMRWWREAAMPWGCLAVFAVAMLLSAWAEGHGAWLMGMVAPAARMVMEEMAETWAYMALWWAQWRLVHHMQEWRASSYLQTMHFSMRDLGEGFERRPI